MSPALPVAPPSSPLRGALWMVAASLGFATMAAAVKVASQDLPVLLVVHVRSLVVTLLALLLARARGAPLWPRSPRLMLWRAGAGFCAMACYFTAISRIPLATAVTLQYTAPVFVFLLSPLLARERPARRALGAMAGALAGVILVVRPQAESLDSGALYALASAVLAAAAYLAVRRLRLTDAPETIVFDFGLLSALVSSPGLASLGAAAPSPKILLALLVVGLGATTGQLCMTYAYRHANAAFVSAFSYVAVVFSAGYGLVLFGEVPPPAAAVGAVLIVTAGLWLGRAKR